MSLNKEQEMRYSRHFVLKEIGLSGQKKLLSSSVLVIGAGAIGSAAIIYLASAGIGTLGIADFDKVDLSNLQRQVIHRNNRTGMYKTESAALSVSELNPDVNVIVHNSGVNPDNIDEMIKKYDFILDCTDRFETKFLINDACVIAKKPYCHAGVVRFTGQVMTYVPQKGPCLRCLLGYIPAAEDTQYCSEVGVIGAATGVIGSIQALEAIKYILGIGQLLCGKILSFDGLNINIRISNISVNDPECKVCGIRPSIFSVRENTNEYKIPVK